MRLFSRRDGSRYCDRMPISKYIVSHARTNGILLPKLFLPTVRKKLY